MRFVRDAAAGALLLLLSQPASACDLTARLAVPGAEELHWHRVIGSDTTSPMYGVKVDERHLGFGAWEYNHLIEFPEFSLRVGSDIEVYKLRGGIRGTIWIDEGADGVVNRAYEIDMNVLQIAYFNAVWLPGVVAEAKRRKVEGENPLDFVYQEIDAKKGVAQGVAVTQEQYAHILDAVRLRLCKE